MGNLNRKYILKKFIRFLKRENIYASYLYNIHKEHPDNKKCAIIITDDLHNNFGLELISSNFSWAHSQEGYSFWVNINVKWNNELRKLLFEDKKKLNENYEI